MSDNNNDQDAWIWGAEAIALAAGLILEDGRPDQRSAFYKLEAGLLPAKRIGRRWATTRRLLNSVFANETRAK
jgi:hypothetical protein